jgi:cytidylate kinase
MGCPPSPIQTVVAVASVIPCVIGFSGRIGSGKTTISQSVADALGWTFASFGEFVRGVARSRNLDPDSREVLQEIGNLLIAQGWPEFCKDVLAAAAWQPDKPLVVDGIRHTEAVQHLAKIAYPLPFVHVHVAVDEQIRLDRLQQRATFDNAVAESHSTEAAVKDRLPAMAHLVVDGSRSVNEVVVTVVAFLSEQLEPRPS